MTSHNIPTDIEVPSITKKKLSLPTDLVDEVDAFLADDFYGKPLRGAWSDFVEQCIRKGLRDARVNAKRALEAL